MTKTILPCVRVSDNRRFLVTDDGAPFFWLGDTAWELFHRLRREEAERYFANRAAELTGSSWAFIIAAAIIVAWAVSGPLFGFSDTWQLVINTGTTIVTFLMVFLIQNTQNRDTKAVQLKLDELLRAVDTARTSLVDLEDSTDEEIEKLRNEFKRLHDRQNADAASSKT